MTETLPLFPLESVLYPGVVLPLHIFEPRYRLLVQELRALPEGTPRRFGVVAIRDGHEVGRDAERALFDVGCTAEVENITERDGGRYDIITTGVHRFRLFGVDSGAPYLRGEVEFFDEPSDAEAELLGRSIVEPFTDYQQALARVRGVRPIPLPELPDDPTVMSYLVAAALVLDIGEKQKLLSAPQTTARLRMEASLLRRETALLNTLGALPAVDLLRRRGRK